MEGRRALLVAADEFSDLGLRALVAPRRDAEQLARILSDPEIGGFDVQICINRPRHEVERVIARFFADSSRRETDLLYFSGHGLKDEGGHLYFAMPDTEVDLLSATAVASSFVNAQLDRARAETKIVLLDCCYSGAFSRAVATKGAEVVDAAEELRGTGRVIITASNAIQYSFEDAGPEGNAAQSVFTKHLVRGLDTGAADLDGNGTVTVDELYRYVHDEVTRENPQQRPNMSSTTQGVVVVAKSRVGARPAALPDELTSALGNPLAGVRLGALQELEPLLHGTDARIAAAARGAIRELADDDSRRVAEAAAALLGESRPPEPPELVGEPGRRAEPAPPATPRAEAPTPAPARPPTETATAGPMLVATSVPVRLAVPALAALCGAVSLFSYLGLGWGDNDTTGVHNYADGTSTLGAFGTIMVAAVTIGAVVAAVRWRRPSRVAIGALILAAIAAVAATAARVHQLSDKAHFNTVKGTSKLTLALLVVALVLSIGAAVPAFRRSPKKPGAGSF